MKDLFGGIQKSLAEFVQIWLLSAVMAVGLWSFSIFPLATGEDGIEPFVSLEELSGTEEIFAGAFVALAMAMLFVTISTPVYRLLEGYYWPKDLRRRAVAEKRAELERLRDGPRNETATALAERHAKLEQFPRDRAKVMATDLGNSLRSAETYGSHTYGINTVAWWDQLLSVTDEPLRNRLNDARTRMDFLMGILLSAPLFALASLWVAIAAGRWAALWGLLALLVVPVAYRGVVLVSVNYGAAVRAVTDVSRHGLAEKLGVVLPATLQEERVLWQAYSQYIEWGTKWSGSQRWQETIDTHRSKPTPTEPQDGGDPPEPPSPIGTDSANATKSTVSASKQPLEIVIVRPRRFRRT